MEKIIINTNHHQMLNEFKISTFQTILTPLTNTKVKNITASFMHAISQQHNFFILSEQKLQHIFITTFRQFYPNL